MPLHKLNNSALKNFDSVHISKKKFCNFHLDYLYVFSQDSDLISHFLFNKYLMPFKYWIKAATGRTLNWVHDKSSLCPIGLAHSPKWITIITTMVCVEMRRWKSGWLVVAEHKTVHKLTRNVITLRNDIIILTKRAHSRQWIDNVIFLQYF